MLFSPFKHFLDLYITGTALKVYQSMYFFTTSISHGVEKYFTRLWAVWDTGISDSIFFTLKCVDAVCTQYHMISLNQTAI